MRYIVFVLALFLCCSNAYGQGCDTNTQILLHLDGSDGSTTMTDENCDGSGAISPTSVSGDAQIDTNLTDAFSGNSGVLMLDGTGDSVDYADRDEFSILAATNDSWTLDMWIYITDLSANCQMASQYQSGSYDFWRFGVNTSGAVIFGAKDSGASNVVGVFSGGTISANTWYHVAFIKVNTNVALYVDGSQVNTATQSQAYNYTYTMSIGKHTTQTGTSYYHKGYIDEFRIQKSNYFNADPSTTPDSFTAPTVAYSVDADRRIIIISKFIPRDNGDGYDRIQWEQNFGWKGIKEHGYY